MTRSRSKGLAPPQREELLSTLKARFEENMPRQKGMQWDEVRVRLESRPDKLRSLHEMEGSCGEPDVIGRDGKTGEYL